MLKTDVKELIPSGKKVSKTVKEVGKKLAKNKSEGDLALVINCYCIIMEVTKFHDVSL